VGVKEKERRVRKKERGRLWRNYRRNWEKKSGWGGLFMEG